MAREYRKFTHAIPLADPTVVIADGGGFACTVEEKLAMAEECVAGGLAEDTVLDISWPGEHETHVFRATPMQVLDVLRPAPKLWKDYVLCHDDSGDYPPVFYNYGPHDHVYAAYFKTAESPDELPDPASLDILVKPGSVTDLSNLVWREFTGTVDGVRVFGEFNPGTGEFTNNLTEEETK